MGFVFQDYNLIPSLTAAENVALPLELDGIRARQARRQARHTLDLMSLMDLSDRYPDQMSGGQQQRVAIARALVGSRRFVLADEPTGALDSHTGEEVLRVLRERCDEGVAGLLVTHEARHAAWADRVVFLRDGVVVDTTGERETPEDLLATRGRSPMTTLVHPDERTGDAPARGAARRPAAAGSTTWRSTLVGGPADGAARRPPPPRPQRARRRHGRHPDAAPLGPRHLRRRPPTSPAPS